MNNENNTLKQDTIPNVDTPTTPVVGPEPVYVEPVTTTVTSNEMPTSPENPKSIEVTTTSTTNNEVANIVEPPTTEPVNSTVVTTTPIDIKIITNPTVQPTASMADPIKTTDPVISNEVPTSEIPKARKKNKAPIIILVIIILLLLAWAAFGIYSFILKASPKDIFTAMINTVYTKADQFVIKEEHKTIEETLAIDLDLAGSLFSEYMFLNDLEINLNLKTNNESKEGSCDFATRYMNKSLLNGNLYVNSEKMYIKADELMNYHIYTDLEQTEEETLEMKDLKEVFREIKEAINISMKDRYFTESKETLTINGKDTKLNKATLTLDKTNKTEINENFFNALLNSENFLKIGSKVYNKTVNEFKIELNKAKNQDINDTTLLINVYTKGIKNEFVKIELVSPTDENVELSVTQNGNEYILTLIDGTQSYEGSIKSTKDGENTITEITVNLNENNMATLKLTTDVKYDEVLTFSGINESKNVDSLTEVELQNIYNKLLNNETILKFFTNFQKEPGNEEYIDYDTFDM